MNTDTIRAEMAELERDLDEAGGDIVASFERGTAICWSTRLIFERRDQGEGYCGRETGTGVV